MDPKLLAETVTEFLAPALPALVAGGQKLVEKAGEGLGEKGGEWVKTLWGKLRGKVEAQPAAAEAVKDVAREPENPDARSSLRLQLKKILEADPGLAEELGQILEKARPGTSYQAEVHGPGVNVQGKKNVVAGPGGFAVGRDLHGNVTLGGRRGEDE
jgi:hypothetical protein